MIAGYIVKHITGTLLFIAILFISAGRLDYWQGLVYLAISIIMSVLSYTVLKIDRDLLNERSRPGEGTKKWDKVLLGLSFPAAIATYIVAGLDSGRYHWSPEFHSGIVAVGIVLTITGQLLFLVAQKQNRFFSSTVRIQTDRGHTVCDTGLYTVVRHPAYAGTVIQLAGLPLLFCSLWSIIPVCFSLAIFIIRTYLEDKTLANELNGYREYCVKTRYKMVPFIW